MKLAFVTEEQFAQMTARVKGGVVGHPVGPSNSTPRSMGRHEVRDVGTFPVAGSNPAPSPPFLLTLAITGQLPSGKNQVQLLFRKGKVCKYPNKVFTNWRSLARVQILEQRNRHGIAPPITVPVRLTVAYWPGDKRTRDVSGQLDALMHILVYASVLKDDGLIYDCAWKRQELNRKFPKVVMEIEPWEA